MNNAALRAKALLESIGWTDPSDMSMEELAWACGLMVKKTEMDGSEGRILMYKKEGIISINSAITYQPKINYILAHEIGHACLHRNISYFADTDKTLAEWHAGGNHETEANDFATELLMPAHLFTKRVTGRKLDLDLIGQNAAYFGASKTATILRYRDLGDFPVMILFIENGHIKWKSYSHDFPFTWLPYGSAVPAYTVAGDYYYKGREETKPEKVDAIEWFPDDFQAQKNERQKLWEQCFPATRESIVTCLWTF